MTRRAILLVLTVLLLGPLAPMPAAAQDGDGARLPAVTVSFNLERVKRKLAALPASDATHLRLDLDYYLEVFGRAPRLNLLEGFDVDIGPVPFGGPTHADLQDLWTPREFRTPAADLSSLFNWFRKR